MWIIRINLDGTEFAEREPLPQANQYREIGKMGCLLGFAVAASSFGQPINSEQRSETAMRQNILAADLAAERESAYVIDGLMGNDVVKSDIHSTDTHGFSEAIFAVTHLLGRTSKI